MTPRPAPDPEERAALFAAVEPVEPRAATRDALLARVAAAPAGLLVRRAAGDDWEEVGVPGLQRRILCRDVGRRRQTYLLRVGPGMRIPPHRHPDVEECYVLEGDLHSFGTVFHAGDYVRADAGTRHGTARSEQGCLLLLTAGLDDE